MKLIETKYFNRQIKKLEKIFKNTNKDYLTFSDNINIEPFSDLWNWFFKYRLWNSSIPSWKRWWYRIIIKTFNNKILPVFIYSKTIKENITEKEMLEWLKEITKELNK